MNALPCTRQASRPVASAYRFFFFINEGGEPPHIHVEAGGGYAKRWLAPLGVASAVGLNRKQSREIRMIVMERRLELLEAWDAHFRR